MPWHAWIKAWTNEESHEAERKKDPHKKRERRKEDGKKEGRKESKKEIMKERSNETRKQRKHYLLGLLLYWHWVFIGVFMNASSTVATQRWIPLWSNIFNSLHVLGKLLQLCLSNHLTNSPNLVRLEALVVLNMVLCFLFRICVYQCLSDFIMCSLQVTASWINHLGSRCVLKEGELQPSQVGVVTPYMGQVRRLRRTISQNLSLTRGELLVASVDSFQGREKELRWKNSVSKMVFL